MNYKILREDILNPGDILQIEKIMNIERPDEVWYKESFIKKIKEIGGYYITARQGDRIIGILGVGPNPSCCINNWIYILIVDKTFRNQGIGTILIQEAIENSKKLFVDVGIDDSLALRFYRKIGFSEIGRLNLRFGDKNKDGAIIMKI